MTSASSLHFGPEWMRKPSRSLAPLSPNITGNSPGTTSSLLPTPPNPASTQLPNVSSYSSLLTSASPPPQIKSEDENYPFRYSKEQLLRVWKDGRGRGGLGLEVERWPGIVREVGGEPQGVKEMTPEERKLFSIGVNSDPPIRRNTANLSLGQSNKLGQGIGIGLGPASPRGIGTPRRRGTGAADDPAGGPFVPRKLSLSSTLLTGNVGTNPPSSPGGPLPSPNTRTRLPSGENSDATADVWARGSPAAPTESPWSAMGARRRTNDASRGWGNAGGTPGIGLGIGRGISFGSLANGTPSGNSSADEKISPSVSPGPGPVSTVDAVAPANEDPTNQPTATTSDAIQTSPANTIYATNGIAPEPTEDFANIQWSYKDPTGQIQGPFAGATMQQWFETGYFNEDLLIKRTHVDSDFEPLRDFRRRAPPLRAGETHVQMFLSPLAPRAPPNLPPPQALLRGADTPPNPSPRLAHLLTGLHDPSNHGPMSAGASGSSPLANSPALSAAAAVRSSTLDSYLTPGQNGLGGNDALVAAGGAGLTNVALERKKREEFIQSLRERELAMGVGTSSPQAFGSTGPFGAGFVQNPSTPFSQYTPGTPSAFNSRLNVPMPPAPIPVPVNNASLNAVSPFPHNGPVLWSSTDPLATPGAYTAPSNNFDHGTIYQSVPNHHLAAWQASAPTWENEQHELPPAVEAAVSITDETLPIPDPDALVYGSPSSSMYIEPEIEDGVENVALSLEEVKIQEHEHKQVAPEPELTPPATGEASTTSNKRKNKNKAVNKEPVASAPALTPPTPGAPASPPAPGHATAWATTEEKPASLRDIQEAEARKAEARKAAERVVKVSVSAPVTDEVVTVTGSWGLPQVGARVNAPGPATGANNGPAWTKPAAAPTGKKSMKEIQEEEERRKKSVAAAAAASTTKETPAATAAQQAAKRAYAESAKNVATTAPGGAWTTVGPQGKSNLPTPAVRQPSTTSAGAAATRAVPGSSAPRPTSSASNATQPTSAAAKPAKPTASDETPMPPSLDFLKWLKESLKGLNGINVEDFMQMLLSFPLDPSPAVIEIISDSIYANSSTLDGRRFAAEFCQKRKADAAAARAKPGSASGAKVPRASLAEVVKTQPKPVQSEWGFKTVQKKPKGGRK
ncbi:GYF domain-containing protein mpd2 [Schizosaccharomyces pombe 972h-] [Rhizoctonia solani]|uniref:GYF domain-containing protein mpd2 [Schizosaccharomyces pombe 972h-] n=1 Tax=Rhizoctonia solani TaxID=456999 RepID=A0A0K6FQ84_9AGAM|nr:GYF domain-containing protein mpd2 [Schizosaccharomyces pombe 972h-] [Rhizoctonia solani]